MNKENKKLTIVSGDGKDLEISPVYEHLKNERPKCNKKPTHIVVPKSEEDNKSEHDSNKSEQNRTISEQRHSMYFIKGIRSDR